MIPMICKGCHRQFDGAAWMTRCLPCYKRFKQKEREEQGARVAEAVDARRREARRQWRKLKGPGEGQAGETR